jgi:hypothetical protein
MKSKKGQLDFIIVLVVIMAFVLVVTLGVNTTATVGFKQTTALKAYSEGEQAREYFNLAARYSIYRVVSEHGGLGENCFAVITSDDLRSEVKSTLRSSYIASGYQTGYSDLNVTTPKDIQFDILKKDNKFVEFEGKGDFISVSTADINYTAALYFKDTVTCDQYNEFVQAAKTQLLVG